MSSDIEYSEEEAEVDVDSYKTEELPFGKYRGCTFEYMIRTPRTREYLKYLLKWDELKPVTRANIKYALAAYNKSKNKQQGRKPGSKETKNRSESPKRKRPAGTNE
jgi:hypothetical protein